MELSLIPQSWCSSLRKIHTFNFKNRWLWQSTEWKGSHYNCICFYSNLPFISKLTERIILSQINDSLTSSSHALPHISGFTKRLSTESLILFLPSHQQVSCLLLPLYFCRLRYHWSQKIFSVVLLTWFSCEFSPMSLSALSLLTLTHCEEGNGKQTIHLLLIPVLLLTCRGPQGSILGPFLLFL